MEGRRAFPLTLLTAIGHLLPPEIAKPIWEGPWAEKKMGYSTSCSPSKASPNKVITTSASISTRGVGGHAGDFPEITPVLHHQRRHWQASMTLGLKAFLSGGTIVLAALKARSHS